MMNRIAEREERALLKGLLKLAGEVALMESEDRLFADIKIPTGGSPLHATAGMLYLHTYHKDNSTARRNYDLHYFHGPRRILVIAPYVSRSYSASRGLMVGDLLDGARVPSLDLSQSMLQVVHSMNFDDLFEKVIRFEGVSWSVRQRPLRSEFALPDSPDLQANVLYELIRSLNSIENSLLLTDWLEALVERRVSLTEGMLPDSPALAIIKRILDIDVDRGVKAIRPLLRPSRDLPFRFGHFQLSLTGVLLAKLSTSAAFVEYRSWIYEEIEYIREKGVGDLWVELAILSALLAIAIIVEEATTQGINLLDKQIECSIEKCHNAEEKRFFLRFLGDSLSQVITESNVLSHLLKLMTFIKYVKDEPSLMRPQNLLLRLLSKVFEPARALLTS